MPLPIVSVSQLTQYIKGIFDAEELLIGIRVEGEISGFSVKGDNAYFTLKDEGGQISCCCFRVSRTLCPKNGDHVVLTGRPDFYPKNGRLSFIAEKIELKGLGQLYLELLALKEKLTAEGLFDPMRKKPLPQYPRNVCVVTSHQGAVIQDIISTIWKKTDRINITAVDVRVQGVGAAESIVFALKNADIMGFDVIILARGGGSFEDLMPFNTEVVARALAEMRTPTISAVGHETDFTLSDAAADIRALTPTAAAELIVAGEVMLIERYRLLSARLVRTMQVMLDQLYARVQNERRMLTRNIEGIILKKEHQIALCLAKLEANNPQKIFEKGYIAAEKGNERIVSISQINKKDTLRLIFKDGSAIVTIERKDER